MKKRIITVIIAVALTSFGSICWAASADEESSDKTLYRRLLRDIRSVDKEHSDVLRQCVTEAKEKGQASLNTKNRLLAAVEKRDRIMNRLTLLCLRHGWELPESEPSARAASEAREEKDRIFQPADEMIKQVFATEAKHIAGRVSLPVISVNTPSTHTKERKKWLIF